MHADTDRPIPRCGAMFALHPIAILERKFWIGSDGSFASVWVCPLSGHCGDQFLRQGRDGPTTDSCSAANNILLFDHLIGAQAHDIGHVEAERLDDFEVEDEL